MASRYEMFDPARLRLRPLGEREHLTHLSDLLQVGQVDQPFSHEALPVLAERIAASRGAGGAVVLMMGAHVIKEGLSRCVIDLMRRGALDLVALNGAGVIHDFELAKIGATAESVADYIRVGQFGLWRETGRINEVVSAASAQGLGFGEAVGREILQGDYPHREVSILAAGYELGVPVTVHVGIGYDIIHAHPNFDATAAGAASGRDFLIFARKIEQLEGGVLLCFGSAVMGPEVYLKALSMARNVAAQEGRQIRHFTTAVFDLLELPADLSRTPSKTEPAYYYRPLKTILIRTVADGGESFYVRGGHRATLPALHKEILSRMPEAERPQ
ncbi:MAG: hypothetical protein AMJ81_11005 [Phycisphaerae bacterium SM23_33]|nr:MAG: hypothetical protein AMJ81_11005 [Phycisphaerae bacterium SM23_33]